MDSWHIGLGIVIVILLLALITAVSKDTQLRDSVASLIRLFRPNILILSTFVFTIIVCLLIALKSLIDGNSDDDFVKGALIGLIGTGITALTALGNNILEKDSKDSEKSKPRKPKSTDEE